MKYLNGNKVLRAKILTKDVLKRQILKDSIAKMIVCAKVNTFSQLISSTISQQNTHFNMYIETSQQQQSSPCKNSHPKCFKTTNFDRFHLECVNQYTGCIKKFLKNVWNRKSLPSWIFCKMTDNNSYKRLIWDFRCASQSILFSYVPFYKHGGSSKCIILKRLA